MKGHKNCKLKNPNDDKKAETKKKKIKMIKKVNLNIL